MSLKPEGQDWTIREQIVEDPASGLTFQFEVDPTGKRRFRIFGNLPFGNREIIFDQNGKEAGAGTAMTGLCRPAWLQEIDAA